MRKEYLPAILLYVASAIFYIAAAVMFFTHNYHWATVLLFGIITMLFASSRLVKIGKKLREEEKGEEKYE
jgi:hypothetical protein